MLNLLFDISTFYEFFNNYDFLFVYFIYYLIGDYLF